jgi:hypothetical protein
MRTRARYVEVILIVFGVYSVLLAVFMFVAPGTFFDTLGNFGARNDHYIFDNATFEFPLGLMMLAAARWSSWRVPALAFAPRCTGGCTPSATSSTPTTARVNPSACSRPGVWW